MPSKDLQDRIKAKEASRSEGTVNSLKPKLEAAAEDGGANERNGPQHPKHKGDHGQEDKAKFQRRCSPNRRSLKEELTRRIGHEANEAKKKRKSAGEVSEENPQDQRAKDEEQNADATFDDDPQLPGQLGTTQAIKARMQAESRGLTIAAIAIKSDHHDDDDKQPEQKYPRSSSSGRSSGRGRLIEAITDKIKLNKVAARTRERDEQNKVAADAMQANSAKLRKTGSAFVQGRVFEQEHMHAPT